MSIQKDLGIAIQQLRRQRGLSQERLALDANVDRRYMSDIENGKRNISLDIMERIAKQLGIVVSELLLRAENVEKSPLTTENLRAWLCDNDYEGTIVLESPDYLSAIIGITEEGRLIYSYEKMAYGIPFVVTPLISEEQLTSSAIHSENHVAENGRKIGKRVISNQALPLFVPPVMYGSVRT